VLLAQGSVLQLARSVDHGADLDVSS
jgi:hypothetical protein